MELLSVIRRWRLQDHFSIRGISRRTGLSRNSVRKYLRSDIVEPLWGGGRDLRGPGAGRASRALTRRRGRTRRERNRPTACRRYFDPRSDPGDDLIDARALEAVFEKNTARCIENSLLDPAGVFTWRAATTHGGRLDLGAATWGVPAMARRNQDQGQQMYKDALASEADWDKVSPPRSGGSASPKRDIIALRAPPSETTREPEEPAAERPVETRNRPAGGARREDRAPGKARREGGPTRRPAGLEREED